MWPTQIKVHKSTIKYLKWYSLKTREIILSHYCHTFHTYIHTYIHTYMHTYIRYVDIHELLQHTYSAAQVSRVWTPPIHSAHSSHPSLWNKTWVTAVEHLWTICCTSVRCHRSIPWVTRGTTVNWGEIVCITLSTSSVIWPPAACFTKHHIQNLVMQHHEILILPSWLP